MAAGSEQKSPATASASGARCAPAVPRPAPRSAVPPRPAVAKTPLPPKVKPTLVGGAPPARTQSGEQAIAPRPASSREATSGAEDADTAVVLPPAFAADLAELARQRSGNTATEPAPPVPPPAPSSSKLAPLRTPAPLAIVRGTSFQAAAPPSKPPPVPPSRPAAPPSPPASSRPAAPPSRSAPPVSPVAGSVSMPGPIAARLVGRAELSATMPLFPPVSAIPAPPETLKGLAPEPAPGPVPVLAVPSTPKAFAPSGVPSAPSSGQLPEPARAVPYERAFRSWSSPQLPDVSPDDSSGPLTYQVYTAESLAQARMRELSRPLDLAPVEKKPGIALRVGLALLGIVLVLGTAAAVAAAAADDPPAPRASAVEAPPQVAPTLAEPPPPAVPVATVIAITEPAVEQAAPSEPAPAAAAKGAAGPKPSARTPAPPASLRGLAPPPNPYAGTPSSVLRPPPGFKKR